MYQFVEFITQGEIFMHCSFYSKILSKVTIASVVYVIVSYTQNLNLSNHIVDMQTINNKHITIIIWVSF